MRFNNLLPLSLIFFSRESVHSFVQIRVQAANKRPFSQMLHSSASDHVSEKLRDLGFTQGLCETIIRDSEMTSYRFWIVDNSGSMSTPDGQRLIIPKGPDATKPKLEECTRWKELQEAVAYHADLAGALGVPTEFRLLNGGILNGGNLKVKNPNDALKVQKHILRTQPMGVTPLARHVNDIGKRVEEMRHTLEKEGKRVTLTIATDGLPTDTNGYGGENANSEFGKALGSLSGLPIWIVIRLCTDDSRVVDFYNNLDSCLELAIDVLDDFEAEAKEIHKYNKWLSYGLPLHRFREGGYLSRLTDLLDERKLTKDELRDFAGLLFGEAVVLDGLPDPQADWNGFRKEIDSLQKKEELVYNPISSKLGPWMNHGMFS